MDMPIASALYCFTDASCSETSGTFPSLDSAYVWFCSSRCDWIILTNEAYRLLEQGLTDGGPAGLVWGFIIVAIGFLFVFLSLAEMASMYAPVLRIWVLVANTRHRRAPTSGGQYHWVSEFAPPSCQKFLSYITGTRVLWLYPFHPD
jgi:hypothetical protein